MPVFSCTGTHNKDRWLVDGDPVFGWFPGGLISEIEDDTPIFLFVGAPAYGATHIGIRHAHWVSKQGLSIPELVYTKLSQPGLIYCTEEDTKLKISLRINPAALMVLTLIQTQEHGTHLSVTTLYSHPQRLDGQSLGRYPGQKR